MSTHTTENTVEHQLLKIPTKSGEPHTLLITKTQSLSKFDVSGIGHRVVTLDVLSTYVSGPIPRGRFFNSFVCRMGGKVDTLNDQVKLTNGGVIIDPTYMRGLGIGSFLFDSVVRWAKDFDSLLHVVTITASDVDATEDNQERRNRFYTHFGIRFIDSPVNEGVVGGHSLPMRVADLTSYDGWKKKMQVHKVDDALRQMGDDYRALAAENVELTRSVQAKERAIAYRDNSKNRTLKVCACIIIALALTLWWKW